MPPEWLLTYFGCTHSKHESKYTSFRFLPFYVNIKNHKGTEAAVNHDRFLPIMKSAIEKGKEIETPLLQLMWNIAVAFPKITWFGFQIFFNFVFYFSCHEWKLETVEKHVLQNFHKHTSTSLCCICVPQQLLHTLGFILVQENYTIFRQYICVQCLLII